MACVVAGKGVEVGEGLGAAPEPVYLWVRRAELAREINLHHTNEQYWPGGSMPANLLATSGLSEAASSADICILAVPAFSLESLVESLQTLLAPSCIVVSLIKSLRIDEVPGMPGSGRPLQVFPWTRYLAEKLGPA